VTVSLEPVAPTPTPKVPPLIGRRDGDLLRATASTVVVMTHCINLWVRDFYARHDFLSPGALAVLLDQFSRFTVPAFFLLSGYALTMQQKAHPLAPLQYYRHRMPRILAPFFLWSALTAYRHLGFIGSLPWSDAPGAALGRFAQFFFLKGFDYQYYFLIVIFQFYLIFPFIYRWTRSKWFLLATLVPMVAIMSPVEAYYRMLGWQLPPLYAYLLVFFGFYCAAGSYAAWNPGWMSALLTRMTRTQAWTLWIGALALVCVEFWVNIAVLKKKLAYADHFNRWVVLAYCVASFILFLKHRDVFKRSVHAAPRWQWFYAYVAPFSFFVYLAHTHLLRLADTFLTDLGPLTFVLRIAFVLLGSYALAHSANRALSRFPRIRFALGLPKD
jgi:surface polysaccharide O-acyltransferase-like enzyme